MASLIEILPRGGEAESGEEGEEKEEGGSGNVIEDKLNTIMDKVGMGDDEKFPGRRYNVDETKETVGKDRKPWQNVLIMELE